MAAKCYAPLWHPSFGRTNLRLNVCYHQYDDGVGTVVCVEPLEHARGERIYSLSPLRGEGW